MDGYSKLTFKQKRLKDTLHKHIIQRNSEISAATITQLIHVARQGAVFPSDEGRLIWNWVRPRLERRLTSNEMESVYFALCSDHISDPYMRILGDIRWNQRRLLDYPVLDDYHIIVTDDDRKAREEISKMKRDTTTPVYLDTENNLFPRNEHLKLAAVTICDVYHGTILLWRVPKLTPNRLQFVRDVVEKLSEIRQVVTWGEERDFVLAKPYDLQKDLSISGPSQLESLKDAAWRMLGFRLIKSETVSDWTAHRLTPDQVEYALMDPLMVYYLHIREVRRLAQPYDRERY
uniref:3'-5' exonuclease domain-containing protein n=1 Tax=Caenorhabditis tropicalis TaxID=1561998 RepID=A0A1I7T8W3_9PELO